MTDLSLLPGWAMAPETMAPLRDALLERLPHARVNCHALPAIQMSTIEPDMAEFSEQLPPGVLVGWSLGGTLAVQLQRRFPERFPTVVTLCSNPCFVSRRDWSEAMPSETFKAFYNDFRDDPDKTLKRFALLITQGSEQGRRLSKALDWSDAGHEQLLHALAMLGVLDNRIVLKRGLHRTLHCLAHGDALVPASVAGPLSQLDDASRVVVHPQASHALPLEQPLWLAEQIALFLQDQHD